MPPSYALGDHFEALVRSLVASGRYNNASEVVRAGLRFLEDHEATLRARQAALEASFEDALADVEAGHTLTEQEVRANIDRRHEAMARVHARR
ncbi:type II toxin-antitoxin system ParD family antitoxin [Methylopila sp. Yamaguchi]|uniref:type II toxin-antitoxin system ParD family antitoxin n=1 Tax=Methylopila sp. Yamaguchi TaxID=1437817 RepID=UPI000CB96044|nr:type II toxin-antitoxin system ParD family antitoxin [Methylopila sp. Yamaguchi]GBD50047.1 hypothetical protein METY_3260 [Methylopila sp. Yamaguchi]